VQEFRADAAIQPYAARHVLHIGADAFAISAISLMKVTLVQEKHWRRIDELRRFAPRKEHRRFVEKERPISSRNIARARSFVTPQTTRRDGENPRSPSLRAGIRIGCDIEIRIRPDAPDSLLDLCPVPTGTVDLVMMIE